MGKKIFFIGLWSLISWQASCSNRLDFLTTPSTPIKRIWPKPQGPCPWISNYFASLINLVSRSSDVVPGRHVVADVDGSPLQTRIGDSAATDLGGFGPNDLTEMTCIGRWNVAVTSNSTLSWLVAQNLIQFRQTSTRSLKFVEISQDQSFTLFYWGCHSTRTCVCVCVCEGVTGSEGCAW